MQMLSRYKKSQGTLRQQHRGIEVTLMIRILLLRRQTSWLVMEMELTMNQALHIHLTCQLNPLKRKTEGKDIETIRIGESICLKLTNQTLQVEDLSRRSALILILWNKRQCWRISKINSLQNNSIQVQVVGLLTVILGRKVERFRAKRSLSTSQANISTWFHRIRTCKYSRCIWMLKRSKTKAPQILTSHNLKWDDQWSRVGWNLGCNPS